MDLHYLPLTFYPVQHCVSDARTLLSASVAGPAAATQLEIGVSSVILATESCMAPRSALPNASRKQLLLL